MLADGHRSHTRRAVPFALLGGIAGVVAAMALGLLEQDPARGNYDAIEWTLERAERAARPAAAAFGEQASLMAANTLQRAIQHSRANAKRSGLQPIPPEVKADLQYYFSKDLLERVRWTQVGPEVDLGSLVAAWYRREGGAVTLQDVIVYSHADMAQNRTLWAHELTHALQYEKLGLAGFARAYLTNYEVLERQARENADRIAREIRRYR
jgi:hypothetical protein